MSLINTSTEFGQRVERRLADEQVIWLTTVRKDGLPQPSPLWFVHEGDSVLLYSQPNTPKLRNIEANPRVACAFNSTPSGGDVVIFAGTASVDADAPPAHEHAAFLRKYESGIEGLGMTPEGFAQEYSVPVRVTLERLRGF